METVGEESLPRALGLRILPVAAIVLAAFIGSAGTAVSSGPEPDLGDIGLGDIGSLGGLDGFGSPGMDLPVGPGMDLPVGPGMDLPVGPGMDDPGSDPDAPGTPHGEDGKDRPDKKT